MQDSLKAVRKYLWKYSEGFGESRKLLFDVNYLVERQEN